MHPQPIVTELDDYLDALGQQPELRICTQLCLCFPVNDKSSYSRIVETLTQGLKLLSASFPWVAGQVSKDGDSADGSPGIFKIKALDPTPRLIVKDHRNEPKAPTMDNLREASFPCRMLDEDVIAPRKTIPSPKESTLESPVFLLQANLIAGGLILTFVGQHQILDMPGLGQTIHLFSKACRAEPFTSEELSTGNLSRRNLIPLIDNYKPGPELARQIKPPTPSNASSHPPESAWAYFTFSAGSLSTLKSLATSNLSSGYVSTDDTLSAFIWQSITRARLPRLDPTSETTFGRAVDARRYLNIPKTYPGLVQNMAYHTHSPQKLVEDSLGVVAAQLRSAVDPATSDLGFRTRALTTFLHNSPDKNAVSVIATLDLPSGLILSSWANIDAYDLDFNLRLGKPEAVRRPQFMPFESLVYLMPKTSDGEITAAVCLRLEDMERLSTDEAFTKYGRYIP